MVRIGLMVKLKLYLSGPLAGTLGSFAAQSTLNLGHLAIIEHLDHAANHQSSGSSGSLKLARGHL